MSLNLVKMAREAGFHVGDQFVAGCSEDDLRKLAVIITRELNENQPPQRKPLTDEEMYALARQVGFDSELMKSNHDRGTPSLAEIFARAIEAAHGIKGEA